MNEEARAPETFAPAPLETWAPRMPKARGEMRYVFRDELQDLCDEMDDLKAYRGPLPWYFTLSSAGWALALAAVVPLLAYFESRPRPPLWSAITYAVMVAVGATAGLILLVVALINRAGYDARIDRIVAKVRAMEAYRSKEQSERADQ